MSTKLYRLIGDVGSQVLAVLVSDQMAVTNKLVRRNKMVRRLAISAVLAISVISGAQIANSEDTAPTGNKGFTASKTTVVDLGPEIEGMAGRQLRMRVLTIEPGGYIGLHSHEDRPAVVYFMQGTDEVGLADGSKRKIMHPGDTSTATKDTTHYHRNIGNDDVVLIAVDVFHSAAK